MKQPPKRMKTAALHVARLHLALACDPRARARDEAKMLSRLHAHAAKLERAYSARNPGLRVTRAQVLAELDAEARRLGPVVPVLGQDM